MNRQGVIGAWVWSGVRDFCLYTELNDRWYSCNAFFLHQGLEKLCKAYLLGKGASAYEEIRSEQEALDKVQDMAKGKGHDLINMLKEVGGKGTVWFHEIGNTKVSGKTGLEILTAIQRGYQECRYPLPPNPVHREHPLQGDDNVYVDLLGSSMLEDFALL
jgi:hypothetical protein